MQHFPMCALAHNLLVLFNYWHLHFYFMSLHMAETWKTHIILHTTKVMMFASVKDKLYTHPGKIMWVFNFNPLPYL